MRKKVDFLVIGSGIAGLSFALKAAEHGKVVIVTKAKADEGSTKYAQGGIAAVMYQPDSYDKHIHDTIVAGDDLNNKDIVEMTIRESTDRIKELIKWGTGFDKTKTGKFDLGKEGGHSENRVLHYKDKTGFEIETSLLEEIEKHPDIELYENYFTIDLITQHHLGQELTRKMSDIKCFGAYILDKKTHKIHTFLSKFTILATGGAGNVYISTTNPIISTGDGVAMAYRAKATVENMEFMQFHPTSLYNPKEKPAFLITEALRGFGAVLIDHSGEEFVNKYDSRGSLAPRDIVARAIDNEMKITGAEFMYLDCRHLNKNELLNHFPTIYAKCLTENIDITKDLIPIIPAAHYMCGGVKVDEYARSSIENLYVSGECSSTGLHGANRLASNSLLEALVFSHRAVLDAKEKINSVEIEDEIPDWDASGTIWNEEMILITQSHKELRSIMSNYVGIVRSNLRLKRAFDRLEIIYEETEKLYLKSRLTVEICELRNLINVAYLIIIMAQKRKESRGLHFSLDYPKSIGNIR